MPIRAILFDHDGTLVDSYEGIARCMSLTCRDIGKPEMSEEEVRASIGPSLEERFTDIWGTEISESAAKIYRAHYETHFISGTRILPGVKETLDAIARKNILIACVTNKTWTYCVRQLEHFGLMNRMVAVIGAKQGLPPKPDPAMLHAALDKLQVSHGEAAMVGDTPIDVAAARAAGVEAWAVRGEFATLGEIKKASPDKYFETISQIIDFI